MGAPVWKKNQEKQEGVAREGVPEVGWLDGGRGVLDCSCLPGSIFSPNSWRQDPEQAPRHWHHPHPSRQQIPYRAEPSAWGAGPPSSRKPSWEDLSFPSPPGVGERRDPGAADMPRLHLQPRAPSLQHCGGREPAAASPRRWDLGQASQAQGSAPPRSWLWDVGVAQEDVGINQEKL